MRYYCNLGNQKGFSLIELLIVILVINILAAVAITAYVGLQANARRAVLLRSASSAEGEIKLWLQSSIGPDRSIRTVDTNFDGAVTMADLTNQQLQVNGVALTYANGRNIFRGEQSPIFTGLPMWYSGPPPIPNGRISLIQISSTKIRMVATERNGIILYETFFVSD